MDGNGVHGTTVFRLPAVSFFLGRDFRNFHFCEAVNELKNDRTNLFTQTASDAEGFVNDRFHRLSLHA